MKQSFKIEYLPDTVKHVRAIERKHHRMIREKIEEQLRYEPFVTTRNRKPLRADDARWELRFGPQNRFRVIYRREGDDTVVVQAIGIKDRNVLRIGDEEITL